jgi:hypothetical protein
MPRSDSAPGSDGEVVPDSAELVPRERQIRLRTVKREVQEKVLRAIGIGHEANQVILPGKCAGGSDAGAGIWLGEITAGGALRRPKRSN